MTTNINPGPVADESVEMYPSLRLCLTLATMLQFDSLAYVNFWVPATFILSLTPNARVSEVRETY